MNIRLLINDFLKDKECRGYSLNTIEDYSNKLRYFQNFYEECMPCYFGDVEFIEHSVLSDYCFYLKKHIKNSITIQSYIRSLRAFLNWCYYEGFIQEDLCKRFKLPKARKKYIDVLTDEEINRIYDVYTDDNNPIHLRNKAILSCFLDCGLRVDEVVTASRARLHISDNYLIVTGKGNKQRAVSFGTFTNSHIRAYLQQAPRADPLFIQIDGSPITHDVIKNMFRKLKKKTGISRLHPHLLRHTFATRYLENGGNIYDLKELLGHTTLKQVQTYLHLANTRIIKDFSLYSPLDNIKKAPP